MLVYLTGPRHKRNKTGHQQCQVYDLSLTQSYYSMGYVCRQTFKSHFIIIRSKQMTNILLKQSEIVSRRHLIMSTDCSECDHQHAIIQRFFRKKQGLLQHSANKEGYLLLRLTVVFLRMCYWTIKYCMYMSMGIVKEGFDCNIGHLTLSKYSEAFLNFVKRHNCKGCLTDSFSLYCCFYGTHTILMGNANLVQIDCCEC